MLSRCAVVVAAVRVIRVVTVFAGGALIAVGVLVHRRRPHHWHLPDSGEEWGGGKLWLGQLQIGTLCRVPVETSKGDPNKKRGPGLDTM